jgi:hypothetical protein
MVLEYRKSKTEGPASGKDHFDASPHYTRSTKRWEKEQEGPKVSFHKEPTSVIKVLMHS